MSSTDVKITKKADDPLGVTRVSVGGSTHLGGYYLVYRGKKEDAREALELALMALAGMIAELGPKVEPDIAPDNGKKYA